MMTLCTGMYETKLNVQKTKIIIKSKICFKIVQKKKRIKLCVFLCVIMYCVTAFSQC